MIERQQKFIRKSCDIKIVLSSPVLHSIYDWIFVCSDSTCSFEWIQQTFASCSLLSVWMCVQIYTNAITLHRSKMEKHRICAKFVWLRKKKRKKHTHTQIYQPIWSYAATEPIPFETNEECVQIYYCWYISISHTCAAVLKFSVFFCVNVNVFLLIVPSKWAFSLSCKLTAYARVRISMCGVCMYYMNLHVLLACSRGTRVGAYAPEWAKTIVVLFVCIYACEL